MLPMQSLPIFSTTIHSQVYSKANSRRIVPSPYGVRSIKSAGGLQFEKDALKWLNAAWRKPPIEGELAIVATIYYPDQRQDLDASLVFDALQKAGVIKNDRQLRVQYLYHAIDKDDPRVELSLFARTMLQS